MGTRPDERSQWSIRLQAVCRGTSSQNLSQGMRRLLLDHVKWFFTRSLKIRRLLALQMHPAIPRHPV